jgi:hypothetical protein
MLEELAKDAGCEWVKEQSGDDTIDSSPQLDSAMQFKIVIDCVGELQQAELLEEFEKRAIQCKAMMI